MLPVYAYKPQSVLSHLFHVSHLGRGQLCTDLKVRSFADFAIIHTDPEPPVYLHAAAALISFCEGIEHDTLVPYLDPIVENSFHAHQSRLES